MARGQGVTVFIIIILLVVAAGGLNYMQHLNAPTQAELDQEQQAAEAKVAAAEKKNPPPPPSHNPMKSKSSIPPMPRYTGGDAVAPSDLVIGNPHASTVLTLGYTADTQIATRPDSLVQIANLLQTWASSHPNDEVKIVCLDLPQDQLSNPADQNLPLGLALNGKSIGGCDTNPGDGIFTAPLLQTVLQGVK